MEEKLEKNKRKTNLDDEIYLLTYGIPYYKDMLSLAIYGEKGHPTIINKIKKMTKRDPPWVFLSKYDELPEYYKKFALSQKDKEQNKKHYLRRHYIYANPKILLNKIITRLRLNQCELTVQEIKELEDYITSEHFKMEVQGIVECSYSMGDYYGGEIRDVFYSLLNMILIECAFHLAFYQRLDEMYHNSKLIQKHGDLENDIENSYDNHKEHFFFPLNNNLMKKLYKLDVHTSNKLTQSYVIYGDRIFDQINIINMIKHDKPNEIVNFNTISEYQKKYTDILFSNIKKKSKKSINSKKL